MNKPSTQELGAAASFSKSAVDFEKKVLLDKVGGMTNLPTPSTTIMEIMLKLRNEDIEIRQLVSTIRRDQSLVAQILKMINSGYYGLRKQIDSVERAVNLLGIIKIKQIVYAASIMDMFTNEEKQDWNHAYTSSLLMGFMLEDQKIPAASNLPLVMLMHDIGKLVLRRFAPTKYKLARAQAAAEMRPVFIFEESLIHVTHAEIGAWLLQRWQMTDEIIKPVLYHHLQGVPPDLQIETILVQFVDWVDNMARGRVAAPPSQELSEHTGFQIDDNDYWINTQRSFIESVEGKAENGDEKQKRIELVPGGAFVNTKTSRIQKSKVLAMVKSDADGNLMVAPTETPPEVVEPAVPQAEVLPEMASQEFLRQPAPDIPVPPAPAQEPVATFVEPPTTKTDKIRRLAAKTAAESPPPVEAKTAVKLQPPPDSTAPSIATAQTASGSCLQSQTTHRDGDDHSAETETETWPVPQNPRRDLRQVSPRLAT